METGKFSSFSLFSGGRARQNNRRQKAPQPHLSPKQTIIDVHLFHNTVSTAEQRDTTLIAKIYESCRIRAIAYHENICSSCAQSVLRLAERAWPTTYRKTHERFSSGVPIPSNCLFVVLVYTVIQNILNG